MTSNLSGRGTIAVRSESEQRARIGGQLGLVETDQMSQLAAYMARVMPRDPRDMVPFGPNHPLAPAQLDPSRPDTGRAEPRIREYEVAVNLPGVRDHHHVAWNTLRLASENVDIMRRCIELRKDHIAPLKWAFTVSPEAVAAAYQANPAAGKTDLERELREKYTPEINRLTEFWLNPWKTHGIKFAQWVRGMMEQHLVYDSVCVYPEMSYGGDLLALNLIDARTIKPLSDYRGQRPQAPYPAFQQMLYGFPRGEFRATVEDDDAGNQVLTGGYLADQLYYYRKNFRVQSMYGYSPTEQALIAARLYLKRQGWMLSEYDDGVVPEMIIQATETSSLTPTERIEYERTFNDQLTGQTQARHRAKFLFPGTEAVLLPSVDERYKPDYDLYMIKLLASFYGVSITSLGFTESKGLGSSGMHEAMQDAQEIASIEPDKIMITDMINDLSRSYVRAPAEIEFQFVDDEDDDTLAGEQANQILVTTAQATVNDGRRRRGEPLFTEPEADMPFILGAAGPVFLAGLYDAQQATQKAAAAAAAQPAIGPGGQGGGTETDGSKTPRDGDDDGKIDEGAVEKGYAGPDGDIAQAVYDQLAEDYPPEAIAWVKAAHWSGPKMVPIKSLDMDDRDSWRASKEPDKVAGFAQRQKRGQLKPAVLIQEPDDAKIKVGDGHHRALAAERNGRPLLAYVGRVGQSTGPWDEMHSSQNPDASHGALDAPTSGAGSVEKGIGKSVPSAAKLAEQAAYRRWIRRDRPTDRAFEWRHHSTHEVAGLMKAAGAGGDPDPKAQAPGLPAQPPADSRWPMWALDTLLARLTAKKLTAALTRGLGISALVKAFTAWRKSNPAATPVEVRSWLGEQQVGNDIAKALAKPLADAATEAYAGGSRSADAVAKVPDLDATGSLTVDWSGWQPGSLRAARKILSEDGTELRLAKLLDDAGIIVRGITASRLDDIASVLADGLERGETPATIAKALRGISDDPTWALTVAWTETNRAQNAAALDVYRARGYAGKGWLTARDQRVCPRCQANADEGAIALDDAFVSGDQHPPGHPRCRCALRPYRTLPGVEKAFGKGNAKALHKYWVRGKGRGKWVASPHPFATLRAFLAEYITDPKELDATTAQWVHDGTGHWPGRDVAKSFDPDELRAHDGKWTGGGIGEIEKLAKGSDKLKLAGKVPIGAGDQLVHSDKVSGENGMVRLASVDGADGKRELRIGVGGPGMGGGYSKDELGHPEPWNGGREDYEAMAARQSARTTSGQAEHEKLSAKWDSMAPGPERDKIEDKIDDLETHDMGSVYPDRYTAKLTAEQAKELRDGLADIKVKAAAREKAAAAMFDKADENEPGEWEGPLHTAAWAFAQQPLPGGVIPTRWGALHYQGDLDEPASGTDVYLSVVPPGMTKEEVSDQMSGSRLTLAETAKLIKALDAMMS